jgi:hypothetical protein
MEHIQDRECSALLMLNVAVALGLPLSAESPHNDARLHHHMLLQVGMCHHACSQEAV